MVLTEDQEKLRSALLDRKYIEKIFQFQKQAIRDQKIRIDTIGKLHPNDTMLQIHAQQASRYNEDLNIVMEYLEMICLNVSEVLDLAIVTSKNLMNSYSKLDNIENTMSQSLEDIESLKKNKPTIDFITKHFEEQAKDISSE